MFDYEYLCLFGCINENSWSKTTEYTNLFEFVNVYACVYDSLRLYIWLRVHTYIFYMQWIWNYEYKRFFFKLVVNQTIHMHDYIIFVHTTHILMHIHCVYDTNEGFLDEKKTLCDKYYVTGCTIHNVYNHFSPKIWFVAFNKRKFILLEMSKVKWQQVL